MYRFHDAQSGFIRMQALVLSPSYGEVVLKLFPLAHKIDC